MNAAAVFALLALIGVAGAAAAGARAGAGSDHGLTPAGSGAGSDHGLTPGTPAVAAPRNSTLAAEPLRDAAPAAVAQSIRSLLVPAVRARAGTTVLDFWFLQSLPVKADKGWSAVREGTLVGAVNISSDFRDIRGRVIKPGAYTLRFGLQPQNGDHLGVSPFREFLLLIPAALDQDPAEREQEAAIDLSTKSVGGSHPAVWSIDPPIATQSALAIHTTELGHQSVVVEVGGVRFGIVLVGRIDA